MLTGKSKVIGIVAKNSWTEYSAKIIEGAMIRAAQKGYHVKLIPWEENNIKNPHLNDGSCWNDTRHRPRDNFR